MEPLAEAYRRGLHDLRIIEVVADVARAYHGRMPMEVASAGRREIVEATLEATGMRNLFQAIVTVDDVGGRTKPAPDLFLEAPSSRTPMKASRLQGAPAWSATDVCSIYRHEWRDPTNA